MSDPQPPGDAGRDLPQDPLSDLPSDLPPEYAEAYRRGYERAYRQVAGDPDAVPSAAPPSEHQPEPTAYLPLFADEAPPDHAESESAPEPEPEPEHYDGVDELLYDDDPPESVAEERGGAGRPPWLVPALLAGAVLVLLLSAYGVGRVFSSSVSNTDTSQPTPDGVVLNEDGSTTSADQPTKTHKPKGKPYHGPVNAVDIGSASASCESAPGVDSAGNPVRYQAGNVYDGDMTTAWRCDGSGEGEKLTLELPGPTKVGEVGLVPGYAKTDPRSGEDRYKQNNRITKVRWVFGDGTAIEQTFDPSPRNREPQSMRIPLTRADRVVIEILGSERGPRNTVAISEVELGEAAG